MKKYNLTFLQKIELIPIFIIWFFTKKQKRQSWHLVKSSLEKHTCNFNQPHFQYAIEWLKCNHQGCNTLIEKEDFFTPQNNYIK